MTSSELFVNCAGIIGTSYPSGMAPVPYPLPIAGRGFFPVTSGSFHDGSIHSQVRRKILFVGQDWGCIGALADLEKNADADIGGTTGRHLSALIGRSGIPLEECFFTNALFGVRTGNTNVGRNAAWKEKDFCQACKEALILQIKEIKPSVIVSLGRDAPRLLGALFKECLPWISNSFRRIDSDGHAKIELPPNDLGLVRAAILVHPSYREVNKRWRTFKGAEGDHAEIAILKELWRDIQ